MPYDERPNMIAFPFNRRSLLRGAALTGTGVAMSTLFPEWARSGSAGTMGGMAGPNPESAVLSGEHIMLTIGEAHFAVGGRSGHACTVNGTVPGPIIRLKEGQKVRLSVTNTLKEDSSIHWHGVLLPFQMDGVPGVSFPGIKPGQTVMFCASGGGLAMAASLWRWT